MTSLSPSLAVPSTAVVPLSSAWCRARRFLAIVVVIVLCGLGLTATAAGPALPNGSPFANPLEAGALDAGAFAEWVDGREHALAPAKTPDLVVATRTTSPGFGLAYGDLKAPGPRYLRIAWRRPVTVGSVVVRGGGRLSVLKPGAPYPGNPADPAQWIDAVRLNGNAVTEDEVGEDQYAVWILPPHTMTRALRFSHVAAAADKTYAGWLGGAAVLVNRFADVAPYAAVQSSADPADANRVNDGLNDRVWGTWSNGENGASQPVSPEHPETLLLEWPSPVSLAGLDALWAGFGAAAVDIYAGDPKRPPSEAAAGDWQRLASYGGIANQYPAGLGSNWLDFGRTVTTRGVRLVITAPTEESHEHLRGATKGGKRIWLGELMALAPLGTDEPASIARLAPSADRHPPIPVPFDLPAPGYVTLVIDDAQGRRVRNLVADEFFPAGHQTAWWDGTDDLGRDRDAARHGAYHIPARLVAPGRYQAHGIVHGPIDLHYEFSVDSGTPPWPTVDGTGGWLADHSPPMSAVFSPGAPQRAGTPGGAPRVYVGSLVAEQGEALAWLDLDGRKLGGRRTIADVWVGATFLARDDGLARAADTRAYAAGYYHGKLHIVALLADDTARSVFTPALEFAPDPEVDKKSHYAPLVRGLAARDQVVALSLSRLDELLFVDARAKVVLGHAEISDPRGVAYDAAGRLLVLSGQRLLRCDPAATAVRGSGQPTSLATDLSLRCAPLVASGLEDPQGITLDRDGRIYVTDWGRSHQVKIFTGDGAPSGAIGRSGPPQGAGAYDALHMNYPFGLTVDDRQHLWVAETWNQPKRVSVWTLDGKLWKDFYGPPQYGGGGTIDPVDKSRFYYGGMEYRLDWRTGTYRVASILWPAGERDRTHPFADKAPETPLYFDGRQYMTDAFTDKPAQGADTAVIWLVRDGKARPVAALGKLSDWPELDPGDFGSRLPDGIDYRAKDWRRRVVFLWSDRNGDGQAQPDEVQLLKASAGGITVMPDLSFIASRLDDRTVRFRPTGFAPGDVPVYDLSRGETLLEGAQAPISTGGDQALLSPEGWTIAYPAPKPFGPDSIGGALGGRRAWSYPSLWPGLHASHEAPPPDRSGELIGTTRLLGGVVTPRGSDAGSLWAVNGNMGPIYLFTHDGLFVAELFHDERTGKSWQMPTAPRGLLLNDVSPGSEDFWPSLSQTADGTIYLQVGSQSNLVRVDGLDTIRRLSAPGIMVGDAELRAASDYAVETERRRQATMGRGRLEIALRRTPPRLDASLADWSSADWASLDRSGAGAWFDSNSKPYDVSAALAVAGDRLYAAFRTGDPDLLRNSGALPTAPFATGGALDLLIGTSAAADDQRQQPVAGDVRLLVTKIDGRPRALLYRAVVPGRTPQAEFSSPWRTVSLGDVEDVTAELQFAEGGGNYLVSLPLRRLGLAPRPGLIVRGDVGIRRGNGLETLQGSYWNDKATAIVADIPSEAELHPQLWGHWIFSGE